ncbi:MAG: hypothetical protein Q7T55_17710, partial [Solirubrobacteraceae bacterium]|nr:hypothetical protein [Solirubrobacteraceae bacterium]
MATYLYRLGKTAFRRWPIFLAGWLTLFVVVGGAGATLSKPFDDAFTIPGIPSEKAADLQAELFPDSQDAFAQANINVVIAAPEGDTLDQPRYQQAVATLVSTLEKLPQVSTEADANPQLGNPVDLAQKQTDLIVEAAQKNGGDVE